MDKRKLSLIGIVQYLISMINEDEVIERLLRKIRDVGTGIRTSNIAWAYSAILEAIASLERYRNALELAKQILEELMLS